MRLDGKVAIVTGSTRGIGKVIASRFAGAGASVIVVGRTVERGARVVQEIRGNGGWAEFIASDLAREEEVERLIDEVARSQGRVDVVVNNVAATDLVDNERPVVEQTTAGFDHFEADGEVRSLCKFFMPDAKGRFHTGEYDDVLVRTPAGWRIGRRTIRERRSWDLQHQRETALRRNSTSG